jgi:hypothetical protein
VTKTRRLKIRKAAREHDCILCSQSIPKGTEYIEISELDPYDPWKSFVRTEIVGRRHIDCPITESMIKSVIDEALAEHGYHDPRTHSLESSVARDVAVTVINLMLHSDSN